MSGREVAAESWFIHKFAGYFLTQSNLLPTFSESACLRLVARQKDKLIIVVRRDDPFTKRLIHGCGRGQNLGDPDLMFVIGILRKLLTN